MSYYCEKTDVEAVFGASNIEKWADLDSDGDAGKIAARIEAAIVFAHNRVDDLLRGGPYAIPIVGVAPHTIKDAAAKLAGVWLYEARGVEDFDESSGEMLHRLSPIKRDAERTLAHIRGGALRLDLPEARTTPEVVTEDS